MVACLALLLAGCQPAACTIGLATVIPMQLSDDGDALTIPARVGGRALTLIVDTGSEISLVSRDSLPGSRDILGGAEIHGIGGSSYGDAATLHHMELGSLHGGTDAILTDQHFTVDGQKVDGLIGMSLLGGYDIDLDLADSQMRLYRTAGDCSAPVAALPPPLYTVPEAADETQALKVGLRVTIDGKQFNALIDTGSDNTALFRPAARRLGLTAEVLDHDPSDKVNGVGRRAVVAYAHTLDEVGIGDLAVRNMQVSVVDGNPFGDDHVDLLIGMDFVRRAHLWISNSSHSLIVQFPPTASPPLPAGM